MIWQSIFLSLGCVESEISQANYFLIIEDTDTKISFKMSKRNHLFSTLSRKTFLYMRFFKNRRVEFPDVGKEYYKKSTEIITIKYKNNKYTYIESDRCIIPVKFEMVNFNKRKNSQKIRIKIICLRIEQFQRI